MTPFKPVGFFICAVLEPEVLDWTPVPKVKFFQSQTKRPERDLFIPGNITVYLDLSVRQQAPKCDLFINAIRYTRLYV